MAKPNQAPKAVLIISNLTPQIGEAVTVDPTQSIDPDGQIRAMDLFFGDELRRVPLAVQHYAWTTAGEKNVELIVYDQQGKTNNAVMTVIVQAAPVEQSPTITQQPVGVTVQWGEQAQVEVKAEGPGPLVYQWFNGTTKLEGQTNAVLRFAPTANSSVWCLVGNPFGDVQSDPATVIVTMPVPDQPSKLGLNYRRTLTVPPCYASYAYGTVPGRVVNGQVRIIFSGDQVHQGSPIYEFAVSEAPQLAWAGEWYQPYGGKRGTWVQPQSVEQGIDRLRRAITQLTHDDPGEALKVLRELGSDVTLQKSVDALQRHLQLLTGLEGRPKSEWTYLDFDGPQSSINAINGGHFFHPETGLLYVTYGDTYNVTSRPDCNVLALRLKDDGTTEAFGPWRVKVVLNNGDVGYGNKGGGPACIHPFDGSMVCSGGMGSGNANCPWGANYFARAPWPTETTPTSENLEMNLVADECYLYSYPMIQQFTEGVPNGPIKSMRRPLHPAVGEWMGGGAELFADPAKNNGVGSWTDNDGQAGIVALPDRVYFAQGVGGSPIQDPTNPQAAHVWYSTILNNFMCAHGHASPVAITGPVSTARFPGLCAYKWADLNKVKNKEIEDYTPEPYVWANLEQQFNITTAPIGSVGNAKGFAIGFVVNDKLYGISHGADYVSVPGLALPLIHEFDLL